MTSSDDSTPHSKIAQLIKKSVPRAEKPKKSTEKQPLDKKQGVIYVAGNGNVVAGGDVTQNITNNAHHYAPVRPQVVVKTGDGTIDAAQKAELKKLVAEWVATHQALKQRKLSWVAAWASFNSAMKVNSYAELKPEQMDKAKAWLLRQTAILNSMASAPKKLPELRAKRYASIKARCKNQLGDEFAYLAYIKKYFNKSSLTELDDTELDRTYRFVMSKKHTSPAPVHSEQNKTHDGKVIPITLHRNRTHPPSPDPGKK